MRPGTTMQVQEAIGAPKIVTAMLARLEFKSETVFVWTGVGSITPIQSGDTLLDGNKFDALNPLAVSFGENTFSYTGSEELTISLNIPADQSISIGASQVFPNEYQTRPATLWRALLYPQVDPLAKPIWLFRRLRSGAMDKVEIVNNGSSHIFTLTIESHQASLSNATHQTWLDQKKYDAADTSQDHAVSIANGDPAPSKSSPLFSAPGGMIRQAVQQLF